MSKFVIKFEKADCIKYVSHLDLVRVFGRTMRRANLPISHSQGFNPHPLVTFAHPLSIGISSIGELAELNFDKELDEKEVMENINKYFPNGIRITEIKSTEGKNNFGKVALADYILDIHLKDVPSQGFLDSFLAQPQIMCIRKTKSKTENTDIKPYILSIELLKTEEKMVQIKARIKTGAENLKPLLVATAISDFLGIELEGVNICRLNLLDENGILIFDNF